MQKPSTAQYNRGKRIAHKRKANKPFKHLKVQTTLNRNRVQIALNRNRIICPKSEQITKENTTNKTSKIEIKFYL